MEFIHFGLYNIHNGRNGGLGAALCGMAQPNANLGILQETKITSVLYAQNSPAFRVVASEAPSRHRRGVTLFHREYLCFAVEAHQQHDLNVSRFQLVAGGRRCYVVVCYLAMHDASNLERDIASIVQRLQDMELSVARYSNANWSALDGHNCNEKIAAEMATEGLEDMAAHFLSHSLPWTRDVCMWIMLRRGKKIWSRADYILGTDRRLFQNFTVRDPRHNTEQPLDSLSAHPHAGHKSDYLER